MGAELLHADGLMDRNDEANTRLPQFFANSPKNARSFYRYRYVSCPKLVKYTHKIKKNCNFATYVHPVKSGTFTSVSVLLLTNSAWPCNKDTYRYISYKQQNKYLCYNKAKKLNTKQLNTTLGYINEFQNTSAD